ncbi:MAG: hypothetical protein AB1941_16940 [Gemmatimonadota bacterium]
MGDRVFFGLLFLAIWLLADPVMGADDWRFDVLLGASAVMFAWDLLHWNRLRDRPR